MMKRKRGSTSLPISVWMVASVLAVVGDVDAQQRAMRGVERGLLQGRGVHLAEAL